MSSALPKDVYVSVQAEADTRCTWYLNLEGRDVLVYVTVGDYLRVKEAQSPTAYTLESDVAWCSVLNTDPDGLGARLYFVKRDGSFWLLRCKRIIDFGLDRVRIDNPQLPTQTDSFSVAYRVRDGLWTMVTDDLLRHSLFTARDDLFSVDAKSRPVYNCTTDPVEQVRRPTVGIHQDSKNDVVTVSVDYYHTQSKYKGVATYVLDLFKP